MMKLRLSPKYYSKSDPPSPSTTSTPSQLAHALAPHLNHIHTAPPSPDFHPLPTEPLSDAFFASDSPDAVHIPDTLTHFTGPLTTPHTLPLCVAWWDETEAIKTGAKYSQSIGFYTPPDAYLPNFLKWLPAMYNPYLHRQALIPDMLPITSWEQNVRTHVSPEQWDRIRKHIYSSSGWRCEICATKGPLEAHEKWTLHNESQIQELDKIMSVCPTCHKAYHLGFAKSAGMLPAVKRKLLEVNHWTPSEVDTQIQLAHDMWEQRSLWTWTLNLDYLYRDGLLYV